MKNLSRLLGALKSGNMAAYMAMLIKLLSPFTKPLDKALAALKKKDSSTDVNLDKVVIIISPPRSGSTVLFQTLTRAIRCIYLSNLHALAPNYASRWLKKKGYYGKNLSNFKNYYGYTSKINDVYEGNEFMDAIFDGNPDHKVIRERFVRFAGMMRVDKDNPLIIKNVRNYTNVLDLYKAVPEITFLRIRRNPEQIIQSELRAFYELGTFHPIPEHMIGEPFSDPLDFAVRQIHGIESKLDEQFVEINPDKKLEWSYESFCESTRDHVYSLVEGKLDMNKDVIRAEVLHVKLKASNRVKVSEEEANRIHDLTNKYFT